MKFSFKFLFKSLLNKQDLDDAMDEVEICNEINIEQMVNDNKCPTKIVSVDLSKIY